MQDSVQRKEDHISLSLENSCKSLLPNGFDHYRFEHIAFPELDFDQVDTSLDFLGKHLAMPLLISSITGGSSSGVKINEILAEVAESFNIGLAVGSQRVVLENHNSDSFQIRKYAPTALVFANLGAVQLNYGFGIDECRKAIDTIEADALILHINPLQEIFQPNGNTNFSGLLEKVSEICAKLSVPVVVKEVGYGISASVAKSLYNVGVKIVDVAGSGSVSWSSIESARSDDPIIRAASQSFKNWGNVTADLVEDISKEIPEIDLIASGGITNGVEIAKALALGAKLCGIALPFLKAALKSNKSCENLVKILQFELKTVMFCTGAAKVSDLKKAKLEKI